MLLDRVLASVERSPEAPAFIAEDGERVTIVEFADAQGQEGWRTRPEHVEAQNKGRREFYTEYKLQICDVVRESAFGGARKEKASG